MSDFDDGGPVAPTRFEGSKGIADPNEFELWAELSGKTLADETALVYCRAMLQLGSFRGPKREEAIAMVSSAYDFAKAFISEKRKREIG